MDTVSVLFGWLCGMWTLHWYYKSAHKIFIDEMHKQYMEGKMNKEDKDIQKLKVAATIILLLGAAFNIPGTLCGSLFSTLICGLNIGLATAHIVYVICKKDN